MTTTRTRERTDRTQSATFSEQEVYDAVKNLRRRYVLYYLNRERKPVELGELAEQIAAWENNIDVEMVSPEQRKSVYSALYQTHLPKLETIGIVTYDRNSKRVSFTEGAQNFELYLATDSQTTIPWHKLYMSLSGISTVLVVFGWMGFISFSGFQLAAFVLFLFGMTAIGHFYDRHVWQQRFQGTTPDLALEFDENRWFQ
ncbi:hypothetical protein SAMN05421858_0452 [Haladaptatus litoreus]|uniref:DUF7344 domain-containing protein n=1 Tax=Haladaptatus litoreus TaxID=553468 RepID=A0A1N6VRM4_9EURY|nr:hypothetical protein [Haladaptatus litoreus]SIQ80326.1 hypothetical protein SAMN05421858_0452 [Haladaptatus litoreus]